MEATEIASLRFNTLEDYKKNEYQGEGHDEL
jgi:hypothetical protein